MIGSVGQGGKGGDETGRGPGEPGVESAGARFQPAAGAGDEDRAVIIGFDVDSEGDETAHHRRCVVPVRDVRQRALAVGKGGDDECPIGDALGTRHRHLAVHRSRRGAQPPHESGDTAGCMPSAARALR